MRFEQALERSKAELEGIKEYARKELGEDKAEIFAAHLLVLSDPELLTPIRDLITNEQVFRTQLRALLHASIYGNFKIMFPITVTLDEFRRAKTVLISLY